MSKRPELLIVEGDGAGKTFAVSSGCVRLGRSSSNDIKILDEELSRNHCLFEIRGESVLTLTDLASANGTYLNGNLIGSDPVELKVGDEITVGKTRLKVIDDVPAAGHVDLGLAETKAENTEVKSEKPKKKSGTIWILRASLLVLTALAAYLFVSNPEEEVEPRIAAVQLKEDNSKIFEVDYKVVEADSSGIYVYELKVDRSGSLTVKIDDVPVENRHHVKTTVMSKEAVGELERILAHSRLKEFEKHYAGVQPNPPALKKTYLKVVYSGDVLEVCVENTPEPEAFGRLRKELESFSKSELGIWAVQYSREKLLELAKESVALGDAKWEDRNVQYGNLFDSISAYKEAIFYMETLNPKPDSYEKARAGLERSKLEMDKVYSEQRFKADRALNLGQWEEAVKELRILLEMVPDRRDQRNRDASEKLISAEKSLKRGRSK